MSPLAIAGCCSCCNTNTLPSLRLKSNTVHLFHGCSWNKGCAPFQPFSHEQHTARQARPHLTPEAPRTRQPRASSAGHWAHEQSGSVSAAQQTPPQNRELLFPCSRAPEAGKSPAAAPRPCSSLTSGHPAP